MEIKNNMAAIPEAPMMKNGILYVVTDNETSVTLNLAPLTPDLLEDGRLVIVAENGNPDIVQVVEEEGMYQLRGRKIYDPYTLQMYGVVSIEHNTKVTRIAFECSFDDMLSAQGEITERITISSVPVTECSVGDIIMEDDNWMRVSSATKGQHYMLIESNDQTPFSTAVLLTDNVLSMSLTRGG